MAALDDEGKSESARGKNNRGQRDPSNNKSESRHDADGDLLSQGRNTFDPLAWQRVLQSRRLMPEIYASVFDPGPGLSQMARFRQLSSRMADSQPGCEARMTIIRTLLA